MWSIKLAGVVINEKSAATQTINAFKLSTKTIIVRKGREVKIWGRSQGILINLSGNVN